MTQGSIALYWPIIDFFIWLGFSSHIKLPNFARASFYFLFLPSSFLSFLLSSLPITSGVLPKIIPVTLYPLKLLICLAPGKEAASRMRSVCLTPLRMRCRPFSPAPLPFGSPTAGLNGRPRRGGCGGGGCSAPRAPVTRLNPSARARAGGAGL